LGGTEHPTPHASRFGSVFAGRGAAARILPRWPQGADACDTSCAIVGLRPEGRAEALSGKYSMR